MESGAFKRWELDRGSLDPWRPAVKVLVHPVSSLERAVIKEQTWPHPALSVPGSRCDLPAPAHVLTLAIWATQ